MNEDFFRIGKTLRMIRKNKGYTQQDISNSTMSRSNYTKLENDEINPNIVKYLAVLDHLDMQHEEYAFILNGYSLNEKDRVIYLFKQMKQLPTVSYVTDLLKTAEELLISREDHLIRDIWNIAHGYLCLLENHDLNKAREYAEVVWLRLKKLDKFYLSELHLLNGILYSFELDTALSLTDKALLELDKYYCFKEADELRLSFLSNIVCILIAHERYSLAMSYIEQLIIHCKSDYKVITLGVALVRKAVCLRKLGNEKESLRSFNLAISLFRILERDDLVELTRKNPKLVNNPYGYVEVQYQSA